MKTVEIAKSLRQRQTSAEAALWGLLRNRLVGGFKFYRQRPIHGFVVDFSCETTRLIIELDGSIHDSPEVQGYDEERQRILQGLGYTFLRFTNSQVFSQPDDVITRIHTELRILSKNNPLLSGEGGPAAGGTG
ncbi:MAG: endonuclease domain-containing protein [Candidatus Melainabacteria bacterium]